MCLSLQEFSARDCSAPSMHELSKAARRWNVQVILLRPETQDVHVGSLRHMRAEVRLARCLVTRVATLEHHAVRLLEARLVLRLHGILYVLERAVFDCLEDRPKVDVATGRVFADGDDSD